VLRILFICHNHPALYPGGAEGYALHVFHEMRKRDDLEPIFLARVGITPATPERPTTTFGAFEEGDDQYWVFADISDFDALNQRQKQKSLFTTHLRNFLLEHRPDVVHVHHTLYMGVDLLREIKNTLPDAAIVYTLHEYYPICNRGGLMVRTVNDEELCDHESPRRCHECFPNVSPADFFLRKRFIQSHLALVDRFLAPSELLRERFIEWGIPSEKIVFSDYGRVSPPRIEPDQRDSRNTIGFFGQLNFHKGVLVLLNAMKILAQEGEEAETNGGLAPRLCLHGANLEWQPPGFQKAFEKLLESPNVEFAGPYVEEQLPDLMAEIDWVVVPSLWWENSPLVIQEAFQYGKPVICSGIGAMKEKVTDGVNGLHFRRGDPESLAATIRRAAASPELWQRLRSGIPAVRSIEDDVESLIGTFRELLAKRDGR
jgi:glycosyltransferase involved in cell wall biosynthesis